MIRASIDLGTNTCLLLVVEWNEDTQSVDRVIRDQSTIVRLGEGVDKTRKLSEVAMSRALECLKKYVEEIVASGLEAKEVVCVATSQARDAVNGPDFFAKVRNETGFIFKTISGADEARFTFLGGLLPGLDQSKSAVIDIGGGSTEYMAGGAGTSIDMGAVRFTERYLRVAHDSPVTDEQFWACQEAIDIQLESLQGWRASLPKDVQLVAVAGTPTTLAAWHLALPCFDSHLIDQVTLTKGDLHRMVEELKWRTTEERARLPGMEKGREDVILAGALILWRTMEVLNFSSCRVSSRGLRFGVLFDRDWLAR